ncbi:MAG: ABC transporter ATP-binding protein [Candidatus Poribacteria bacterium]|nr:ABC transporter ATP-binding protein [Candidatus Poribacteria bacterium]
MSLQYDGKPPLFREIKLVVETGEFVVIQGASGIGKSSLLRLMNRLQEATAGEILIDGQPITKHEVTSLRRKIGYVQQTPIVIPGSVDDNLDFPFQFHSAGTQKPPGAAEKQKWMETFLIENVKLNDDATKLSVGQKQRIALIRAMLVNPEILLCDEPTSALDQQSKEIVEHSLERLNIERGISIILVTHLDFALNRANSRRFFLQPDRLEEVSA